MELKNSLQNLALDLKQIITIVVKLFKIHERQLLITHLSQPIKFKAVCYL